MPSVTIAYCSFHQRKRTLTSFQLSSIIETQRTSDSHSTSLSTASANLWMCLPRKMSAILVLRPKGLLALSSGLPQELQEQQTLDRGKSSSLPQVFLCAWYFPVSLTLLLHPLCYHLQLMLMHRTEVDHAITGVNQTGVTPAKGRGHDVASREVAYQHRAEKCTGHPAHRVLPDGNGGYKDRLTDCVVCGISTKHYCNGCKKALCFGGVGGKSAGKRIEKIQERMKKKHPNVQFLGSDPNNPPANFIEIGEGNIIYNCCFYMLHSCQLDMEYLGESADNHNDGGSASGTNLDQRLAGA